MVSVCHFANPDSTAHSYGTAAQHTINAIETVDIIVGRLRREIAAIEAADHRSPGVDLIVVSDHGMGDVDPSTLISRVSVLCEMCVIGV